MTISRRDALRALPPLAGAGAWATAAADAQTVTGPEVSWRLASSFPPSSDLLHGAAVRIAERVAAMTDGAFSIRTYAAGEIVPPFSVMDAVMQGTVQCGLSPGYFYIGKHPALAFDTAIPFGLTTRQQLAWLHRAGGLELVNSVYAQFGVRMIPALASPGQMGGWFREPIESLADLRGLRFRIPGMGGEIMARLGVSVQNLPASEIYPALERGAIDATEWVGPYDDEKLGLHQIAKNYYYPGWWEPGMSMGLIVSQTAFDELPVGYQHVLTAACGETAVDRLAIYYREEPLAMRRLVEEHDVVLREYPADVLDAAWRESNAYLEEQAASNDDFRRIFESWRAFRDDAFFYGDKSELAYLEDVLRRASV